MSLQDAFDELRWAIRNVNCYRSAHINPKAGTITDVFGSYEILPNGTSSWNSRYRAPSYRCSCIQPKVIDAYIDCLPTEADYINLRNSEMDNTVRLTTTSYGTLISTSRISMPQTLILPKKFYGWVYISANYSAFGRGLYLNSDGFNVVGSEGWIQHASTASAEYTGQSSVVDFDSGYNMSPMYLNRLYLSTKTFENLANKLGTVTGGKLYLGTKNIDRMTTAQKDAIAAKGWSIY